MGAARGNEVDYWTLDAKGKALYDKSMEVEWANNTRCTPFCRTRTVLMRKWTLDFHVSPRIWSDVPFSSTDVHCFCSSTYLAKA